MAHLLILLCILLLAACGTRAAQSPTPTAPPRELSPRPSPPYGGLGPFGPITIVAGGRAITQDEGWTGTVLHDEGPEVLTVPAGSPVIVRVSGSLPDSAQVEAEAYGLYGGGRLPIERSEAEATLSTAALPPGDYLVRLAIRVDPPAPHAGAADYTLRLRIVR